jgi:transcriptional regulator with XRE-family HTH domain
MEEKKKPSEIVVLFGILTKKKRTQMGVSQEMFAEKCNLHRTYIGFIERGEKTATIDTANKIVQALDMTLGSFFQEVDEMS